ncbi:hypothetical protein INR49_004628 [Caranx melampygus]|nr:hypothetical protein INR49_004548 [Caranx melampygus]KAG7219693.1 hypothetical protein INR49_018908 [Caranx melampygus]KAG7234483.1 hypothetical protein INR49_004628 [Caranx melampygus]
MTEEKDDDLPPTQALFAKSEELVELTHQPDAEITKPRPPAPRCEVFNVLLPRLKNDDSEPERCLLLVQVDV